MVRLGTIDYRAALLLLGLVTAVVLMRRRQPAGLSAVDLRRDAARLGARLREGARPDRQPS